MKPTSQDMVAYPCFDCEEMGVRSGVAQCLVNALLSEDPTSLGPLGPYNPVTGCWPLVSFSLRTELRRMTFVIRDLILRESHVRP